MPAPEVLTVTRPDGSTIEATIIHRGTAGKKKTTTGLYEPVVGPNGDIIRAKINTTLDKAGLTWVRLVEGKVVLTKHAERHGYMRYRDLCLLGIPSEGVEPSPVHWEIYKELCRLKDLNQVPRTPLTAEQMYHPEVERRRKANEAGVQRIDDDAMLAILQGIRDRHDPDSPELIEAARAKGLEVPEPESNQDLGALLERAKKGKRGKALA